MGRVRKPLLPEAADGKAAVLANMALLGLNVQHQSLRVFRRGQFLGMVPLTDAAAAWAMLKIDQKAEALEGENSKGVSKLPPQMYRSICVHCRVMDYTFGDLVPGDLQAAVRAMREHSAMFFAEPGLELASIQGKYMPWKETLFIAWQEHCEQHPELWSPGVALTERATRTAAVVSWAARAMHGKPLESWALHCGKKVGYHSGFLPLLSRMGIVVTDPATRSKKSKKHQGPQTS